MACCGGTGNLTSGAYTGEKVQRTQPYKLASNESVWNMHVGAIKDCNPVFWEHRGMVYAGCSVGRDPKVGVRTDALSKLPDGI